MSAGAWEPVPSAEGALLARARAAIDVTPLSVAAAQGLDAAAVARLRSGDGDPATMVRLARALAASSAELWALAAELNEAARQR